MAIIETSRPVPFGAVSTFRIVSAIESAVDGVVSAYRAHKTEKALSGLSYAQLSDIGLERDEIHAAAQRAAHI